MESSFSASALVLLHEVTLSSCFALLHNGIFFFFFFFWSNQTDICRFRLNANKSTLFSVLSHCVLTFSMLFLFSLQSVLACRESLQHS